MKCRHCPERHECEPTPSGRDTRLVCPACHRTAATLLEPWVGHQQYAPHTRPVLTPADLHEEEMAPVKAASFGPTDGVPVWKLADDHPKKIDYLARMAEYGARAKHVMPTNLRKRDCACCRKTFTPTTGNQRDCPWCISEHSRRERQRIRAELAAVEKVA